MECLTGWRVRLCMPTPDWNSSAKIVRCEFIKLVSALIFVNDFPIIFFCVRCWCWCDSIFDVMAWPLLPTHTHTDIVLLLFLIALDYTQIVEKMFVWWRTQKRTIGNSIHQHRIYFQIKIKMKNDPWKLHAIVYLLRVLFVSSSSCSMNYLSYSCPYFSNVSTFCMLRFMLKNVHCRVQFLFRNFYPYGVSFQLFFSGWEKFNFNEYTLRKSSSTSSIVQQAHEFLHHWKPLMPANVHNFSIKNHTIFRFTFANLKIPLLQMAYTLIHYTSTSTNAHVYLCTLL